MDKTSRECTNAKQKFAIATTKIEEKCGKITKELSRHQQITVLIMMIILFLQQR